MITSAVTTAVKSTSNTSAGSPGFASAFWLNTETESVCGNAVSLPTASNSSRSPIRRSTVFASSWIRSTSSSLTAATVWSVPPLACDQFVTVTPSGSPSVRISVPAATLLPVPANTAVASTFATEPAGTVTSSSIAKPIPFSSSTCFPALINRSVSPGLKNCSTVVARSSGTSASPVVTAASVVVNWCRNVTAGATPSSRSGSSATGFSRTRAEAVSSSEAGTITISADGIVLHPMITSA